MQTHTLRKIGTGLAVAGAGAVATYVWGIRPWHLRHKVACLGHSLRKRERRPKVLHEQ